ncbi:hypothetical protein DRE_04601 [Drechslerella stenobrocha 248]|uniref:Methyltransferase domain-containing protein n=1 Tax=Drechslerella stenobrocha 248 TaxID=1043628 RepID=W7I1V3_9PEZI|nr:hypothetical protein DRE_04601 [Drechslerella stenobrocha 248]
MAKQKPKKPRQPPTTRPHIPQRPPTEQHDRLRDREQSKPARFSSFDDGSEDAMRRLQRKLAAEEATKAKLAERLSFPRLLTWWASKAIAARKAKAPAGMSPSYPDIKIPKEWPSLHLPAGELEREKGPRLSRTLYWWLYPPGEPVPQKPQPTPLRPPQKYPNMGLDTDRPPAPTLAQKAKRARGWYWIAGIGVYAMSSYGVYLYLQYNKAARIQADNEREYALGLKRRPVVDTHAVYENISEKYDSSVRFSEWCLGMPLLRRWMLWGLQGDVLEVSAGTGRNNPYYNVDSCSSITMVDNSSNMLEIAKNEFERRYPYYGRISFLAQDASKPISSPSGEGFDRVIQTMGLCSQESPVDTLRNLERQCKPEGRILLLEHGRSHYNWLNRILDAYVLDHARNWGCFWNRDIGKLLEESGLVVTSISRFHLGTTWLIEASPRAREMRDETAEPSSVAVPQDCAERKKKEGSEMDSAPLLR